MATLRSWLRPACGVVGSRSIAAHLLRGVLAATLLAWTIQQWSSHTPLALLSGLVAVALMRGCPMCWLVGLFDAIGDRMKGRL